MDDIHNAYVVNCAAYSRISIHIVTRCLVYDVSTLFDAHAVKILLTVQNYLEYRV